MGFSKCSGGTVGVHLVDAQICSGLQAGAFDARHCKKHSVRERSFHTSSCAQVVSSANPAVRRSLSSLCTLHTPTQTGNKRRQFTTQATGIRQQSSYSPSSTRIGIGISNQHRNLALTPLQAVSNPTTATIDSKTEMVGHVLPEVESGSGPFPDYISEAVTRLRPDFEEVDQKVAVNLRRVLEAYREARVGSHHLTGSTGYGHADAGGREALDKAFAHMFGAEAAIVRSQFFSGTHAIAAALYAVLRPGDELLAVAGAPYDTLEEVIGLRGTPGHGSLAEFGVTYRALPLTPPGKLDFEALARAVTSTTKCALIQRSCGYSWRETLTMAEIERAIVLIKEQNPGCAVVVDNCYGEFVETREPTAVGADLIAGSLIKNPGGSIAPGGGYVAGREDLVDAAAARLSAPGIGRDAGATPSSVQRLMLQGLFLAPQIVGEAIKGSLLLAEVLSAEGFATKPEPRAPRYDIIQAIRLDSRERLLAFCQAVQTMCPVGAYIRPTAGATAGYESEVVFADGTFIDGSTIELSCDGPLREPFVVYCQGGTHWTHWAIALEAAVTAMRALK